MAESRSKPALLLACGMLLGSCAGPQSNQESTVDRGRRLEVGQETTQPQPARVPQPQPPVTGEAPADLLARVREDVLHRTRADPAALRIVRDESVTWSDGSLGCPRPGEVYPQMLVEGYWIVFKVAGRDYDYRSDGRGQFRLCDGATRSAPAERAPQR
jgi:hypothetical protein